MPKLAEIDLLREVFIPEMRDLIETASSALLLLERDATNGPAINDLFRAVHTIKGTAGMYSLPTLVEMVHSAEDLLGDVRSGKIALQGEIVDDMLSCFDEIRIWTDSLETTGALPPTASQIARERSQRYKRWLASPDKIPDAVADSADAALSPDWFDADLRATCGDYLPGDGSRQAFFVRLSPAADCFYRCDDPLGVLRAIPGKLWHDVRPRAAWDRSESFDPFRCNLDFYCITDAPLASVEDALRPVRSAATIHLVTGTGLQKELSPPDQEDEIEGFEFLLPLPDASPVDPPQVTPTQAEAPKAAAAPPTSEPRGAAERALKVDPGKVDALVNLLGELVVAKNGLPFIAQRADRLPDARDLSRDIKDNYAAIDRIAQELQTAVMSIRMLPVAEMFRPFPRLVRDVSRKLGKQVDLVLEGETTEADKTVIEALSDPLVHILRNSLDHGIELPDERLAAGKPAGATITIRAAQEGDRVLIEIRDDGRGIDPDKMRRSAMAKGLISAATAEQMTDAEAVDLIFLPGFSTATEVSDLSGRGVGMDAVRHGVKSLGGTVAITSQVGKGTSVTLGLPLTMAVTRVMTVEVDGQLYGIPLEQVDQTVRVAPRDMHRIKTAETFVLRDKVLPLVRLRNLLALPERRSETESVLILRLAGMTIGLVVDAFNSGMEVILKPMAGMLRDVSGYAGTAVLGNGKVLLVLKMQELI